ncbi:MAG: 2-oxo acid dehydrogenase subunit E2, partial [Candidatus Eisenbacteria bacterium]|nr:2-oxo acid dehydrogenase subunit E2 [Candidatus Eisenbacteria bacterium]
MTVEVKVPRLAESISEATLVEWLKADGTAVRTDEPIATLETDKAAVEIVADSAGVLSHARKPGEVVKVGDVLGRIAPGAAAPAAATPAAAPAAAAPAAPTPARPASEPALSPAVRRIVEERGLDPAAIAGSGPNGRILKDDAQRAAAPSAPAPAPMPAAAPAASAAPASMPAPAPAPLDPSEESSVVPMNRIRQRIAERLVQAQHTAAILTTFNEIDMTRVLELRARYKDAFEKAHGVKLGFMSLFARACVLALADVPAVNAEIRGTDMVFHKAVHLGIAASTEKGLVVPVVRDAHRLDFAGLEKEIARLAQRARDGQLSPQELSGGTFTITNGGVFGSLLSTPILNP